MTGAESLHKELHCQKYQNKGESKKRPTITAAQPNPSTPHPTPKELISSSAAQVCGFGGFFSFLSFATF